MSTDMALQRQEGESDDSYISRLNVDTAAKWEEFRRLKKSNAEWKRAAVFMGFIAILAALGLIAIWLGA